jgi:hypothetical protein
MLELAHWDAERERNQRQWRVHLKNARRGMAVVLEDSPIMASYLADIFECGYQAACGDAETLIGRQLPENCEWTLEQVQNDDFYPSTPARRD